MCIFSQFVPKVSATRIFALEDQGIEHLVYSMHADIREPLAMVLPLPVRVGSGEDAVQFINLSMYPDFFEHIDAAFFIPSGSFAQSAAPAVRATLTVHRVGAFVASYVPSARDFDRLDPRFRLPQNVLSARRTYVDDPWGFAVFQLDPLGEQTVHPMALSFPTGVPGSIFFPTVHVHDGALPNTARFDHMLACQTTHPVLSRTIGWSRSQDVLGKFVDAVRAKNIVAPNEVAFQRYLHGDLQNVDTWITPPACDPNSLSIRGSLFAIDLAVVPGMHIDAMSAKLKLAADALIRENETAWEILPFEANSGATRLAPSGDRLFSMDQGFPLAINAGTRGPFRMSIMAIADAFGLQHLQFVVATVPSPQAMNAMTRAFERVLRAI